MWSHAGMICTGETYKNVVKMTFAKGASLEDLSGRFNASVEGNTRRAIDFHEGDKIDEKALKALSRAAVALNMSVQVPLARPFSEETKERLRTARPPAGYKCPLGHERTLEPGLGMSASPSKIGRAQLELMSRKCQSRTCKHEASIGAEPVADACLGQNV